MAFQGNGDVFGEIPSISGGGNWGVVIVSILLMMNLITFIFNLIPFPPLDGWKITEEFYEKSTHKKINENVQLVLTLFGVILIFYIFISGIICDFL
jgi:membrane-associated protease RseP (regulator of RpoE activity)